MREIEGRCILKTDDSPMMGRVQLLSISRQSQDALEGSNILVPVAMLKIEIVKRRSESDATGGEKAFQVGAWWSGREYSAELPSKELRGSKLTRNLPCPLARRPA